MGMAEFVKASKTDPALEKDGVWIDYKGGVSLRCRRANSDNVEYCAAFERMLKKHGRSIENDALPMKEVNRLMAEIYADTVVTEWKGVTDWKNLSDTTPLSFTRENVIAFLTDWPDEFKFAQRIARGKDAYLAEVEDLDIKN